MRYLARGESLGDTDLVEDGLSDITSSPLSLTTRFLRPTGPDSYEVYVAGHAAAIIWRAGSDVDALFVAALRSADTTFLGYDSTPIRLAKRIAKGEFDCKIEEVRLEVMPCDEPEVGCTHIITVYAHPSQQEVDRFATDDPHRALEALREVETVSMEQRWAIYAARGW